MKKLIAMAAVVGLLTVVGCKSKNQGGSEMDQNYGNTPADTGNSSITNNNSVTPTTPSTTSTNSSDLKGNTGGTGITPGGTSSGSSSSSDTSNQGNVPNTGSNTNLNNNGQPPQ
jgi:hypothetical protein